MRGVVVVVVVQVTSGKSGMKNVELKTGVLFGQIHFQRLLKVSSKKSKIS